MPNIYDLIGFFEQLDKSLDFPADICICGSSYFVLLGVKAASPDLDIIVEGRAYGKVIEMSSRIQKPFKVDVMTDRWIENLRLPGNYMKRAKRFKRFRGRFKQVRLWTLYPYDIIISKICRWQNKDKEDIDTLLNMMNIYESRLTTRIRQSTIPATDAFSHNLAEFYKIFGTRLRKHWW